MRDELEKLIVNAALNGAYEDAGQRVLSTDVISAALTSIINLVDKEVTEYQKLFIDAVEIGLKGVGLSLNEKEWLDLIAVLRESQKTAQRAIIRSNT